ncbi:ribokinase [Vibrio nigripulchritudo SOn1]|uniref:Ribokinase n=1 Tax=Vibrio nigripulchritudo SOn1 TaxID=1238450 RepID=A0AAV2VRE4_9VIBR|nr:ribokinase [Vibrio nigripulchritudo]CCO47122.1 ribokinase [Vibrio nigripulchritudo SOn1]
MSGIIVFGSVNADHVMQVPEFPRPGETITGRNYRIVAGGKGANQAVACARLGADIRFIACVGDDPFGLGIRKQFESDGIDVTGVKVEPDCPTGIAMIQVTDSGQNSICISAEANGYLTAPVVSTFTDTIQSGDYLLLQLETPLDGIEHAVDIAHQSGCKVVLNPAPARELPDDLLAKVTMITPNETEAEILTGVEVTDDKSASQASQILHKKGVEIVLITLGEKGVWVSQSGVGYLVPGFVVEAVDTTAAGDTFNGALLVGMCRGSTLEGAIVFAHAAAAMSVTRFGAQTSIPYIGEVEAFLRNQGQME